MSTTIRLSTLDGDYVLDDAGTRIGFVARHTMATRVRGQFDEFEGTIHLDGDDPARSRAEVTIQAGSIQTSNGPRDKQLRRTFLHTDEHPVITFASTAVRPAGGTSFQVTGDLTIRGVTHSVTLGIDVTGAERDPSGDVRVRFRGSATINRRDWDVNWNAATGVLISSTVTVEFEVGAIRR